MSSNGKSINDYIIESVKELINHTLEENKVNSLIKKHKKKIHFIPISYRIFGGLLQSMNIQFGNFIEKLFIKIIENSIQYEYDELLSASKKTTLKITRESLDLIDSYITERQENFNDLDEAYSNLITSLFKLEKDEKNIKVNIKYDVDIVFFNTIAKEKFYAELKFDDNHDTGKFVDISRKFLKTYIALCNYFQIYDIEKFTPYLMFLTNKRMKGNIYIPEDTHILRGEKIFKKFDFNVDYADINNTLTNIGTNKDILREFEEMYEKLCKSK